MRGRGCLGGWIEAQLAPLAAGQAGGDEAMRFGEISAQLGIAQARPVVVLDPGQPARGKVGRGPEAGLVLQDLEGERADLEGNGGFARSEEHTSELQSLMRISYAGFCLKKKINK